MEPKIATVSQINSYLKRYLDHNQISDISPLKDMTDLTYLDLNNNQISDISTLKNLTNLTNLDLKFNQTNNDDIKELKQTLPNCYINHNY